MILAVLRLILAVLGLILAVLGLVLAVLRLVLAVLRLILAVLRLILAVLRLVLAVLQLVLAVLQLIFAVLRLILTILRLILAVLRLVLALVGLILAVLGLFLPVLRLIFAVLRLVFVVLGLFLPVLGLILAVLGLVLAVLRLFIGVINRVLMGFFLPVAIGRQLIVRIRNLLERTPFRVLRVAVEILRTILVAVHIVLKPLKRLVLRHLMRLLRKLVVGIRLRLQHSPGRVLRIGRIVHRPIVVAGHVVHQPVKRRLLPRAGLRRSVRRHGLLLSMIPGRRLLRLCLLRPVGPGPGCVHLPPGRIHRTGRLLLQIPVLDPRARRHLIERLLHPLLQAHHRTVFIGRACQLAVLHLRPRGEPARAAGLPLLRIPREVVARLELLRLTVRLKAVVPRIHPLRLDHARAQLLLVERLQSLLLLVIIEIRVGLHLILREGELLERLLRGEAAVRDVVIVEVIIFIVEAPVGRFCARLILKGRIRVPQLLRRIAVVKRIEAVPVFILHAGEEILLQDLRALRIVLPHLAALLG